MEGEMDLFETKRGKGRRAYKVYAVSVFIGMCFVWVYRATQLLLIFNGGGDQLNYKSTQIGPGWCALLGLFAAELWFGFYWVLTQATRWNPIYRHVFKDRLSKRFEDKLPGVDIFVCTADPKSEPPIMVVNTVLSVMSYDYPPEKLSVYLSDDGGSELTFYALLEAFHFAKSWIPFCKKFKIVPRSPAAYFKEASEPKFGTEANEFSAIKKMYKEMEKKIDVATNIGKISDDIREKHRGFTEWSSKITSRDHRAIVQILVDARDQSVTDNEGLAVPTLVYMAREKRPHRHHNFKAGAMNSLIRVSSEISNGPIILNVDCDMYSNDPGTVRDVLCFFMDEKKGHEYAYVQLPQAFHNITKNDIYGNSLRVYMHVDFYGLDGYGGPMYIGTGCFHRRESLCGLKYSKSWKEDLKAEKKHNAKESTYILEEKATALITCNFEDNTSWGKEVGLKYGCAVEDVITGLSIQCRGWKAIYFNPPRMGFLGLAPTTLSQTLVQRNRWSEGHLQLFLSKNCAFIYGHRKIKLGLQLCYSTYNLWAVSSFPTLYYVVLPSLFLLHGIPLYPKVSSVWFMPFAYVITTTYIWSLLESTMIAGMTMKAWYNEQRMCIFRNVASQLFAVIDCSLKLLGFNRSSFIITSKVTDEEVMERYEKEIMEFGQPSPMSTVIAMIAMLNILCLVGGVKRIVVDEGVRSLDSLLLQLGICASIALLNLPVYQAMFFRSDSGRMATSITLTSVALALLVYVLPIA